MPMARISLQCGKSPEHLRALADGVYRALHEAFEVPAHDRFVLIHQHQPHELSIDPDYLGGPRTADFVLVAVTVGRPRSAAVKQAFYRRLVERLAAAPGIDPEDVMVVVTTTAAEDWSFGGGRAGIGAAAQP